MVLLHAYHGAKFQVYYCVAAPMKEVRDSVHSAQRPRPKLRPVFSILPQFPIFFPGGFHWDWIDSGGDMWD